MLKGEERREWEFDLLESKERKKYSSSSEIAQWVKQKILKFIRYYIGNQYKDLRIGVMWVKQKVRVTLRAVGFSILCRR